MEKNSIYKFWKTFVFACQIENNLEAIIKELQHKYAFAFTPESIALLVTLTLNCMYKELINNKIYDLKFKVFYRYDIVQVIASI